jgi:hypothetical protein
LRSMQRKPQARILRTYYRILWTTPALKQKRLNKRKTKRGHTHKLCFADRDTLRYRRMSAFGPKRTSLVAPHMSAFGGKAEIRPPLPNAPSLAKPDTNDTNQKRGDIRPIPSARRTGVQINREEENKMNKQLTPAEIRHVRQSNFVRLAPISDKVSLVKVEPGPRPPSTVPAAIALASVTMI